MIESIDVVTYSAYFLVPGYLISEIIKHFLPETKVDEFEKTIQCLGYSVLELTLWYWFFSIIMNKYDKKTYKYWLFLMLAILVTSFITGIVIGLIKQKKPLKCILDCLDIKTDHPIPTGWDYKFFNTETTRWVCICLDNDTYIRGKYGTNSLASSEPDNHDIYLEEVYLKDENGDWKKEERTDGIWVSATGIKWINFYKEEGEEDRE